MDGVFAPVAGGAIPQGSRVLFAHCGGSPALYPFARILVQH